MQGLKSTATIASLLTVQKKDELEAWLTAVAGPDAFENAANWCLVGNQTSNAGAIEQSPDDINPLIERVVNGMEAVVELKRKQAGSQPSNPTEAIESLFEIPDGKSRLLDEMTAQGHAQFVTMTIRGTSRNALPTIDVRDLGIGLHHEEFANTILALGQSTKGRQPHLIGMYGQGGSSTFDKCEYTVIISRKARTQLTPNQRDTTGWTVVRRKLNVRAPQYSYFIDHRTGLVPWFSRDIADNLGFTHGTLVMHVGYRNLGSFASQQITNNAYYTLNFRLFDPMIPWTLADERSGRRTSRTMRGVPYRLFQLRTVSGVGSTVERSRNRATAIRHHTEYRHRRDGESNLRIAWWILQDEQAAGGRRRRAHGERLSPYRDHTKRYSRRVIAVTRGGQTHAALTAGATFVRKGFRQLSRSMILQVDTDDLSWEEVADFFTSNRADLKTASHAHIEEAINAAIELHADELRAIERERQAELVAGRSASDQEEIRKHLDPMIRAFLRTRRSSNGEGAGGGKSSEFRGKQVPTFVKFARANVLTVRPGVPTRAQLLTDALDEVVRHPDTQLRIEPSNPAIVVEGVSGSNGRYTVNLSPSPELTPGTRAQISASMYRPNSWLHRTEHPLRISVDAPPEPFVGGVSTDILEFSFTERIGTRSTRRGKNRY